MLILRKLPIILLLLLTMSYEPIHRFYVGLTEIRIDTQKKTFNVSTKLFTDDLEDALNKLYKKKIDLASSVNDNAVSELLIKYVNEHFKVFVDSKEMKYKFIGFEIEDNATWLYLELDTYKSPKKINVVNSFLYDFLPEQTNVIQLYFDKETKSEKLLNPNMKAEFDVKGL